PGHPNRGRAGGGDLRPGSQGGPSAPGANDGTHGAFDRAVRERAAPDHSGAWTMSERLIFNCTHGKEDPERATLPFVAANIASSAGQDAVVLCTIDAVWLAPRAARRTWRRRDCRC